MTTVKRVSGPFSCHRFSNTQLLLSSVLVTFSRTSSSPTARSSPWGLWSSWSLLLPLCNQHAASQLLSPGKGWESLCSKLCRSRWWWLKELAAGCWHQQLTQTVPWPRLAAGKVTWHYVRWHNCDELGSKWRATQRNEKWNIVQMSTHEEADQYMEEWKGKKQRK